MKASAIVPFLALPSICAALHPRDFNKDAAAVRSTNGSPPDLSRLPVFKTKPRIFVLTDILNEPDDSESMVRYLLYSNEFDTKAFCATTSTWLRNGTHPEAIRQIITAYSKVTNNLNKHVHPKSQYPPAEQLLSLVTTGPTIYGKAALSLPISEGALKLVTALEESPEPLWVTVWGGANTLAQSLDHIERTKSSSEAASLRSRLRVYTISDQDDTGDYIRSKYSDVRYIASIHAFSQYSLSTWRGISAVDIPGADNTKVSALWLKNNIQLGTLGAEYPTPIYLMEGDTPTFLYLIQNGLGTPEFPHFGSWGGRYGAVNVGGVHFADTVDRLVGIDGVSRGASAATIWRWRDHFQNDFAARIQWSLTSDFWKASHPPIPSINGSSGPEYLNITVTGNQTLVLDASGSHDPDHPSSNSGLEFQWYQYNEPSGNNPDGPIPGLQLILKPLSPPVGTNGTLATNDAGFSGAVLGPKIQVTVPYAPPPILTPILAAQTTIHLILQVTSKDAPLPLRRYKRVLLTYPIAK
ncbi:hypothetical protein B0O99DRAFT_634136 [Bisporella sp. PMI_857]|nr:hypothetical protein B0O99DRAFT_634136 [Bisporella sp. PMI_857]